MRVLRSYVWNNRKYAVVAQADGSRVEIKGDLKMTDEQAMAKVPKPAQLIQQMGGPISAFSDDELVAEVKLRKLVVRGLAI